ncbi:Uncharacterised protein [Salmonella enterica subsp. enterica]|uniref:Uncharacterized protein n=1 Tax=Salmonella enterica I TaxID=59201 RepID=A0A3S4IFM5_SALET|nr:Uncharacterised protein [Salmonella enterica subsp. enterica]
MFIVQQTCTKKEPSGSFEKFYRLPLPGGGARASPLAQSNRPDRRCAPLRSPAVHHRYRIAPRGRFPAHKPRSASFSAWLAFCSTKEDGHTLLAQLLNGVEDLLDDDRRQPQRPVHPAAIASAGSSARGQSPASCCSPPDMVPARWIRRFMQARKQLVHPFDTLLKPIALGKKTAHRQVLFYRHPREDAPPFRHYRHRFTA